MTNEEWFRENVSTETLSMMLNLACGAGIKDVFGGDGCADRDCTKCEFRNRETCLEWLASEHRDEPSNGQTRFCMDCRWCVARLRGDYADDLPRMECHGNPKITSSFPAVTNGDVACRLFEERGAVHGM